MSLPLPDLDTRRFDDLAAEAVATIPRRARGWTDHNLSDPGITIAELLAAELDRLMYAVNRITDRDRRAMLRLLGFPPKPPAPARGAVAFRLDAGAPRDVGAGTVVSAADPDGPGVPLRLDAGVRVGRARLAAVQVADGSANVDRTRAVLDGAAVSALGDDPDAARDCALALGLDPAPDAGADLHLWIAVGDDEDRATIAAEHGAAAATTHHDARVAWEWWDGTTWHDVAAVTDETRALAHDGRVVLHLDQPVPVVAYGAVPAACAWVRCRLVAGRHDAAPALRGIALHAGPATQAAPASSSLELAPGCVVPAGGAPVPGTNAGLALDVGLDGRVTTVAARVAGLPSVTVRGYVPATAGAAGLLEADLVVVGRGDRTPHQRLSLEGAPPVSASCAIWACRGANGDAVRLVDSLDAAGADELVATLDAATGELCFGDGRHGRMLAPDELVLARFDRTAADAGNLRAGATGALGLDVALTVPFGTTGGAGAEDVVRAAGRASRRLFAHERLLELLPDGAAFTLDLLDPDAVRSREAPERGLNALDLERVALATPGCRIARAHAFPELDAARPGLRAAGTATVVVVPELPAGRPAPTPGLLAAVRRTLERRRIVGSRIVVAAPTYVVVGVRATLRAVPGVAAAVVADRARAALDAYLHPLTGGRDGRGWPFGRDVYRADVLAILDAVDGVDVAASLDLVGPDGTTCGNVCVPDTALVAAGTHELEVIA